MKRRESTALILALWLCAGAQEELRAQCILSNPSFEVGATGAQVFGGWNQVGVVGNTTDAAHGQFAACASGPDNDVWDISGFWQRLDSVPGDRWDATVTAWQLPTRPLQGESVALLSIDWRDGTGELISNESHAVLDASSPLGEMQTFTVRSGPAPDGTVAAYLFLGVAQSPNDPQADVYFDLARFERVTTPTIEERQWADFPGGRTVDFSGYTWRVKGPGYYDPGPSVFCDGPECVWADAQDRLHLTIDDNTGPWHSSEVVLEDALGYGDYVFTTRGALDQLDPNVVLGLFIWEYGPCWSPAFLWWNAFNEIDVEFSRWGDPGRDIAQFVAQPFDWPGNISRFDATFGADEVTSHAFRWLEHGVEFRSWRGGPDDESTETLIYSYSYTGLHVPRPDRPRVHINLWQLQTPATRQEVVLEAFTFVPWCDGVPCDDPPTAVASLPVPDLRLSARPNPFNPATQIRFEVPRATRATLQIFDVAGRQVRALLAEELAAGSHHLTWNGRDDAGAFVASGVYLVQLQVGGAVQTIRVSLLK